MGKVLSQDDIQLGLLVTVERVLLELGESSMFDFNFAQYLRMQAQQHAIQRLEGLRGAALRIVAVDLPWVVVQQMTPHVEESDFAGMFSFTLSSCIGGTRAARPVVFPLDMREVTLRLVSRQFVSKLAPQKRKPKKK